MTNDNIPPNEYSNFDKVKNLLSWIVLFKFNASEYAVLLYLINQQYGFIKNGQVKDGDYVGYGFMAQKIDYKRRQTINAVNSLVSRHILIKESGNKFGNHYHINEHCYEWTKSFR